MRDPTLNGETKSYNNAQDGVIDNLTRERDHNGFDTSNELKIQSKSVVGLHGTYGELYRLQNGTTETDANIENQEGPRLRHGRPAPLQRARSDFGPRQRSERVNKIAEEDLLHMRHGWHDEYTSNEYLSLLNSVCTPVRLEISHLMNNRLSTCITPTNDTILVGYPNQGLKHGPTQIGE